ncbi:HD domain-containing protein [Flexithrix dorotheae]|uniref:HD domain-containing protein n=1 Tax=Flexithrix dorotheae TaxID=70993 RepID=UPI000380709A|nr:HD domain-containing protein [Flexithrix dorotheae]
MEQFDFEKINEIVTYSKDKAEIAGALCQFLKSVGSLHLDEIITQYEHGIQTAVLAKKEAGNASLITAALLHDIGHLVTGKEEELPDFREVDLEHEQIAVDFLKRIYPPAVLEPIRLHVDAKRYICTVDQQYFDFLSPASKNSLELQGGRFSSLEKELFEENEFFREAVLLRKWDDRAKVENLEIPDIMEFKSYLEESIII